MCLGKVKNTKGRIHQQLGSRILRMLDYSSRGAGRQRVTKFSFPPTVFSPLLQGKIPDTHTHESGELEAKLAEQPGRRREHQSPGFLLGGFLFFFFPQRRGGGVAARLETHICGRRLRAAAASSSDQDEAAHATAVQELLRIRWTPPCLERLSR